MSTANANPVDLSDVTRHFGRFAALRAVTASFEAGRLYAVLGDNGAGKSTLLRVIAGLIPPTRGKVSLYGNAPSAVRERIAYMAHASLLYDELDAMENLQYFAGLYGIHDDRVCQEAMHTVGLDSTLQRRVGQYSQGMRQRLSLARALLHRPELLLLDEPFSNVDIASAQSMVALIGTLRDGGRTIFVVTHQPSLLTGVADEFIRMATGRIVARTPTFDEFAPDNLAAGELAR
ncbi:MAG: ABC transporter ATP-binding protein [Terriglobales bacterium]